MLNRYKQGKRNESGFFGTSDEAMQTLADMAMDKITSFIDKD